MCPDFNRREEDYFANYMKYAAEIDEAGEKLVSFVEDFGVKGLISMCRRVLDRFQKAAPLNESLVAFAWTRHEAGLIIPEYLLNPATVNRIESEPELWRLGKNIERLTVDNCASVLQSRLLESAQNVIDYAAENHLGIIVKYYKQKLADADGIDDWESVSLKDYKDPPRFYRIIPDVDIIKAIVESGVTLNPIKIHAYASILTQGEFLMGNLHLPEYQYNWDAMGFDTEEIESFIKEGKINEVMGLLWDKHQEQGMQGQINTSVMYPSSCRLSVPAFESFKTSAFKLHMSDGGGSYRERSLVEGDVLDRFSYFPTPEQSSQFADFDEQDMRWAHANLALLGQSYWPSLRDSIFRFTIDQCERDIDGWDDYTARGRQRDINEIILYSLYGKPKHLYLPMLKQYLKDAQAVRENLWKNGKGPDSDTIRNYYKSLEPKDWLFSDEIHYWSTFMKEAVYPTIPQSLVPFLSGNLIHRWPDVKQMWSEEYRNQYHIPEGGIVLHDRYIEGDQIERGYELSWREAFCRCLTEQAMAFNPDIHTKLRENADIMNADGMEIEYLPLLERGIITHHLGEAEDLYLSSHAPHLMALFDSLDDAVNFKLDYDTQKIILLQGEKRSKINPFFLQLPFPSIFIETRMPLVNGMLLEGMLVRELVIPEGSSGDPHSSMYFNIMTGEIEYMRDSDWHSLQNTMPQLVPFCRSQYLGDRIWLMVGVGTNTYGEREILKYSWCPDIGDGLHQRFPRKRGNERARVARQMLDLLTSMVLFIQMSGVTYVERKPREIDQEKRKKRGLRPLSSSNVIVLTGEMKRYANDLKAAASGGGKLRLRHSVIKHPRLLMSDRYKKSGLQGTTIFVDAHERGGSRIKAQKDYEVKK
tara:strand:- start:3510 stop:6119 length:2610 start_codon:yes stop_codon:yes gene_type:complete